MIRFALQRPLALLLLLTTGCTAARNSDVRTPTRLALARGLSLPETAEFDPALDRWFVSLMGPRPTEEDNDGVILRIEGGQLARIDTLAAGGRAGVTLHGPKGLAVVGDLLWVADINTLRAFHTQSGAVVHTIDMRAHGAVAINDVAAHPDGSLYVTDLRLLFAADGSARHAGDDRIYRVLPTGEVTIAARGDTFAQPNGIAWDPRERRFVIAPLASKSIFEWRPGDTAPHRIAAAGGLGDGVAVTQAGRVFFSSLEDGVVYEIRHNAVRALVSGLDLPANFGVDEGRRQLLIPVLRRGSLQLWQF